MAKKLLSRGEVPVEQTWDISLIYKTEKEFQADVKEVKRLREEMVRVYKGHLDTPQAVNDCLDAYRTLLEKMYLAQQYTSLAASVDHYDSEIQDQAGQIGRLCAQVDSDLSFIDSEISELPGEILKEAMEASEPNRCYLEDVLRNKPHRLHPEAERVLSAVSRTLESPYEIYNAAKLADMRFPSFTAEGEEHSLSYSLFEDNYEYDENTEVRRAAFAAFSKKIKEYENVTAAAYNTTVQQEKIMAGLRGFDSVYDYLLFDQKVTREMYDRQIDLIMKKLAPHMRKYAKLLKKVHKLDKMTYADLKLPVDPEYNPSVTIEDSKEYIEKGLAIMGDDYVEMIQTAYRERWIDFAQNQGKDTGGFCASPYGRNSFILLSWNERMSDVFTLAHELGHAGHFRLCNSAQSIFDTRVSTYFVEAPSTMNELLLAHYLLGTKEDPRFRRFVLSNMVSNTYYHNFVTHLLEAAYQREVYRLVDEGRTMQSETLSQIMKDTLQKFWGDAVELTEGAELTWMRQPHYYMGLYSYTYSAGLTIATQMCKRIENEGKEAIEDWKKVLSAGSTLAPVELAALAKIDITTDQPLLDTIDTIGSYIDEICELTEKIS
ncbi:MAG: oligoendopeptidase F [Lachnospiraceae bacterium]|nr:oligoendopeptidase F [Lachnospiraceae bacterium]